MKKEETITRKADWVVTTYDKDDHVIETFVIENRTQREAEREAKNDVDVFDCWDWTITEVDEKQQHVQR